MRNGCVHAALLGILVVASAIPLAAEQPAAEWPVEERIAGRTFPSIFQAWSACDSLPDEPKNVTAARHDLIFHAPSFFGLQWNKQPQGLADGFAPESIPKARAFRGTLLGLNPNLILIAEIRYRDAHRSFLPESHPWWLRDKAGKIVAGWEEGGYWCMDFHNAEYRAHVARQCKAAVETGVVDGVMLDWWSDDPSRLELVRAIREAIGPKALILVNANDRKTPQTAPYVNGFFMECYRSKTAKDWQRIAETLAWAEANLRAPRINCLETWYHQSRGDLPLMRATTALSLTLSNGYCLFSDPNDLPTADHRHDWYPFWNKSLGKPVGMGAAQPDGTIRREFDRGTVVYNPMGNKRASITFETDRKSVATGKTSRRHSLASPDGDLFLRP